MKKTATCQEVISALLAAGFVWVSSCGSHRKFKKAGHPYHIVVPFHKNGANLSIGVLRNIEKKSGLCFSAQP